MSTGEGRSRTPLKVCGQAESQLPFGGTGAAGIGHYYGKYGFDMLTHAKSMLIAPPEVAIDHLFPPYTKEKNEALTLWFEY
jgi:aldehyde dehydrogenase (NAD+)